MNHSPKKHIFLTGFMGAGKSKIGRLLAERLSLPFYDSDKLIEKEIGKNIQDIFSAEGENGFRKLESEQLRKLCKLEFPAVIALGGGTLNTPENFRLVSEHGISIYIKSSPEAILKRVKHTRQRPLLNVGAGPDFETRMYLKICELLEQREKIYTKADIIFDRDHIELGKIIEVLQQKINHLSN